MAARAGHDINFVALSGNFLFFFCLIVIGRIQVYCQQSQQANRNQVHHGHLPIFWPILRVVDFSLPLALSAHCNGEIGMVYLLVFPPIIKLRRERLCVGLFDDGGHSLFGNICKPIPGPGLDVGWPIRSFCQQMPFLQVNTIHLFCSFKLFIQMLWNFRWEMDGCGCFGTKVPRATLQKWHSWIIMNGSSKIIALGLLKISEDPMELMQLFERLFRSKSQAEWTEIFRGARVWRRVVHKLALFRERCLCNAGVGYGQRIGKFWAA